MLSASELRARAERLRRDQDARSERARRKAEKERLVAERVRQKNAPLEEAKRRIREEQLRAQAEVSCWLLRFCCCLVQGRLLPAHSVLVLFTHGCRLAQREPGGLGECGPCLYTACSLKGGCNRPSRAQGKLHAVIMCIA